MRALLILSLIGNAILAAFIFSKEGTPLYAMLHPAKAIPPEVLAARKNAWAATGLVTAMKSNDLAAIRDRLRALGFSDDVVRGVLTAVLNRPIAEIQTEIKKSRAAKGDVFWTDSPHRLGFDQTPTALLDALQEARLGAAKRIEDLMGVDPNDATAFRTDFLPAEKAAKVRALQRDYNELRDQTIADTHGLRVPTDDEKLAFIDQEQRADLVALLTPEELADYDLRNSSLATQLRSQLQFLDPTEAEYKAIFAARKKFEDEFPINSPITADRAIAVSEASAQVDADIRAALGETRYSAYQRSQDPDYGMLEMAAARYNLPVTTVAQTYAARDQAVASAQIIQNNLNLTDDQRRQQLAELANQTRIQIQTTLGPEASAAYLAGGMSWLALLQNGIPITTDSRGIIRPLSARRG